MMKIITAAAIIILAATFAFSQQRITFKRGAREAVVTGNLSGYKAKRTFVIRVRRNQTLKIEQLKPDSSLRYVTVSIKAPDGADATDWDASCNNRKVVSPTRAGDYRIEVYECRKADPWRGRFRLKVRVE